MPAIATLNDGLPAISLRPEEPADEYFLFALYAGTREEELALTHWPEPLRRTFLEQQFAAMRAGYRHSFPAADYQIILCDSQPAGRLVLQHGPAEIRVVDLALLPTWRKRGIGTVLLRQVCQAAESLRQPVRLNVLKTNRARRLYERLDFALIGESEVYDELEWVPATARNAL